MTRLGWGIAIALCLLVVGVASITHIRTAPGGKAAPSVGAAGDGGLVMPVFGVERSTLTDNWGDPREGGARTHHGLDIPAPGGTPVVAAAPGTVEKLFFSERGGNTVYVRSPDRRWTYYYAHLADYAPGLKEGQAVAPGALLGHVGDTGDAGPGNYHLHFSLTRTQPSDRWWQGEDTDPYPPLTAGRLPR